MVTGADNSRLTKTKPFEGNVDDIGIEEKQGSQIGEFYCAWLDEIKKERNSVGDSDQTPGPNLTHAEEKAFSESYGRNMTDLERKICIERKFRVVESAKIIGDANAHVFLMAEYGGHCQICDTVLELGPDHDPFFDIYRIKEFEVQINLLTWNSTCCVCAQTAMPTKTCWLSWSSD